ncbi:MAG: arginine kinase [Rhodospirillaceae bacterium]|nr:arginine kinase [Rhodospirillaceae bacterium]MBT4939543.1 arginine kinase [Rhodospirillaceae bacterium]
MTSSLETVGNGEDVTTQIRDIRAAQPGNLMARYFDEAYYCSLDEAKRERLHKIIRSGIENPDSQMGAYAQNCTDYEDFEPLLEPMIRDYHNISDDRLIAQEHDWATPTSGYNLEGVDARLKDVSMRVRVGRNIGAFPLPGAMTKSSRLEFETLLIEAFSVLMEDPEFGGEYLSLTPGSSCEIDEETYRRRIEAHQMFKDMSGDPYLESGGISSDWPYGRGMYISGSQDFIVWVGEEDHLRVMSMKRGSDLSALFSRLHGGLETLAKLIPDFAHSERYGYLTSCPTNLGSAMRASLHLPLPNLTKEGRDLEHVKETALDLSLAVRGVGGEHSEAGEGGIVDISPRARLGVTEAEIMQCLYEGSVALWSLENAN